MGLTFPKLSHVCLEDIRSVFPRETHTLALRYKAEGRGFDSRWCRWEIFIHMILPAAYGPCFRLIHYQK